MTHFPLNCRNIILHYEKLSLIAITNIMLCKKLMEVEFVIYI